MARPEGADTSLWRGLDILVTLGGEAATENGGLGVVRIAEQLGREKSQVSRALKTLAQYGLVDRDPVTLDYRLGWRLFALAARAGSQQLLEEGPAASARRPTSPCLTAPRCSPSSPGCRRAPCTRGMGAGAGRPRTAPPPGGRCCSTTARPR